ncbi:MAG: 3-keto-5-aminohexanoate cleavage protein [Gammaproteobacteria bacterium]|nr:3-keto-5-aminohexanoate cleavage protein [Gammaproteobacteria bacterium]MDH4253409.1 3-keto-5-aminohexanoate cleavage protein [Gammaproteobacteria bacterium]MDH5309228.1 3-keto-5-aminohexanoate cleavage protein [Gammaproteobacteria bacterium]
MIDSTRSVPERVVIMAAPNGARRGKADHPALPLTAVELAECAAELQQVGVSVLHLHVRDAEGQHTLDPVRYREAIRAIRQRVGSALVLQVTTEAGGRFSREEQVACVRDLEPEAVSLALRELCPDEAAEPEAGRFFAWLVQQRIWPQYIIYTPEELQRFDALRRRGLFADEAPFCLFVLGRYSDRLEGRPEELDAMLAAADCSRFPWAVCCFGQYELDAMLAATRAGGHVRIGFENNLVLSNGQPARNNAELVSQYRDAVSSLGRRPASADELRELWLR